MTVRLGWKKIGQTRWRPPAALVGAAMLLTGCALPGSAAPTVTRLPPQTPTAVSEIFLPAQACPLQKWKTVVTQPWQTHLIAWAPTGSQLAFVGQNAAGGWLYVGDLYLASGPDFTEISNPVKNLQVTGDLFWNPAGDQLAFMIFRQLDAVYSVAATGPSGGGAIDLFPEKLAQTDSSTGAKTVLGWADSAHLTVRTSCGPDCDQELTVDVSTGTSAPDGDPTRKNRPWYMEWIDHPPTPPVALPPSRYWTASPDGRQIAFYDSDKKSWIWVTATHKRYPLDLGGEAPFELAWSADSQYLAVRTDAHIQVFKVNCIP
jgi:hypothetical protein